MTLVRLQCYEPLALDPDTEQPWSDVWIQVIVEDGSTLRLGPTLMGTEELRADLAFEEAFVAQHPEFDDGEAEICAAALETTTAGLYFFVEDRENGVPTLCVPHPMITKAVAEEAIAVYLETYHGLTGCQFEWEVPEVIVVPAGTPVVDGELERVAD